MTAPRGTGSKLLLLRGVGIPPEMDSGIDHILGTTAARIVNHADRPVLVVRGPSVSF